MSDDVIEFLIVKIIMPFVVISTLIGIICIPFLFYQGLMQSESPTFKLYKNEWQCTQAKSIPTMVMMGKIMVPENDTKCIQYEKN
jgi:hypothetical protein